MLKTNNPGFAFFEKLTYNLNLHCKIIWSNLIIAICNDKIIKISKQNDHCNFLFFNLFEEFLFSFTRRHVGTTRIAAVLMFSKHSPFSFNSLHIFKTSSNGSSKIKIQAKSKLKLLLWVCIRIPSSKIKIQAKSNSS